MKRIGVDVGGTFTDFIYVDDDGKIEVYKTSTTPHDPSVGMMEGINAICDKLNIAHNEIQEIFHGTTIATNMVLEHKGARAGMITTKGYRDIIHIARHKRPTNFSIVEDIPWQKYPVCQRRDRYGVSERVTAPNGDELIPLNEEEVRNAVRKMKADKVEAIAVCFLFSFLNPAHEKRVKEIIKEEYPEVYISLSSEVLPQFREYERFTTTGLNAYIGPTTARYIKQLETTLKEQGYTAKVHLMQSFGGVASAKAAQKKPVNLLLSGPVGGVLGAIWTTKLTDIKNVITLDIGGTSADISVLANLQPSMKHLLDTQVGGYAAMVPMIDVGTIGAGGGSMAYIDEGGFFRVGPQSAGAVPGPACYNRGGVEPTVSDANIILGRLGTKLLGGRMEIKPELAEKAIMEKIGVPLNQTLDESALGIIDVMNNNMIQEIEKESVRRGFDPREFALFACGGAGSLHACSVARELGMKNVIVPLNPGALCAVGLVNTDLMYDFSKTEMQLSTKVNLDVLDKDFKALEKEAHDKLIEDNMSEDNIIIQRVADCRYEGQGYEMRVPVVGGKVTEDTIEKLKESFHETHKKQFGRSFRQVAVEIVNIRVIGTGSIEDLNALKIEKGNGDISSAVSGQRSVTFRVNGKPEHMMTTIYERAELKAGDVIQGPAIINQMDTTIVIEPDCVGKVNDYGIIVIDIN
ncbi:MAG: hydantoinase/oxoprolinase family protein [Ruminococcus sp.]|nr:hydantoinase/oxoprolinase family protein [Oscillospiraceae bacterium]MDY4413343.1 hydantoinase/oxoprolinase family protein [Ruminococcus sp.]